MEAQPSEQALQEGFSRIEAALERDDGDLRALGFWRLVGEAKRRPELADRWADRIGAIDRRAFELGVQSRFPVWFGNAVLLLEALVGAAAVVFAMQAGPTAAALGLLVVLASGSGPTVAALALLAAGGAWSLSTHCLAHYVVGRAVGIRFTSYFVGGPFPPRPGLKIEYASYLRVPPGSRALMHAAGAIATKLAPFAALAFAPATDARWWGPAGLVALGILQIVTDVLFSVKASDWKKVKRELALARSSAA